MQYEIDFQNEVITIDGVEHEIAPRRCSYTKELMSDGFLYVDEYVADTDEAKHLAVEDSEYKTWDELAEGLYEDGGDVFYYTSWEIEDEFYTSNGLYFTQNGDGTWSFVQLDLIDKTISINWSTIDVIHRANERDFVLTLEQATNILELLDKYHDCTIGINWDVIDTVTDNYLNE